jgi:spore maturation protein SpmA
MNVVFFGIVLLAILFAVWNFAWAAMTGDMSAAAAFPAAVGGAALDGSKTAVTLAIGLVGYMALFLGLMKVVEEAGGLKWMAGLIRPVLVRLFPDVPHDHPAMGAMVMNISANALGLGNAATPFGLKAMKELNELNKETGTATNAMVRFLAINTSGLALLPTGIIGLRALKDSVDPAAIFPTTLAATGFSTLVGILAANSLARLPFFASPEAQQAADAEAATGNASAVSLSEMVPLGIFLGALVALVVGVYHLGEVASAWIIPLLILGMLTVGMVRKVKVYEVFILGAKEGFSLAVTIIPYLVAILAAVGMFRKSGGMDALVSTIGPATAALGLPPEVLPLALLRPLSGSGAFGITAELIDTHGPDSYIGELASTMNGSTETTFYVLAVYFGSVGVSRIRHAVPAGLAADFAGVVASVVAVQFLLNH